MRDCSWMLLLNFDYLADIWSLCTFYYPFPFPLILLPRRRYSLMMHVATMKSHEKLRIPYQAVSQGKGVFTADKPLGIITEIGDVGKLGDSASPQTAIE